MLTLRSRSINTSVRGGESGAYSVRGIRRNLENDPRGPLGKVSGEPAKFLDKYALL